MINGNVFKKVDLNTQAQKIYIGRIIRSVVFCCSCLFFTCSFELFELGFFTYLGKCSLVYMFVCFLFCLLKHETQM